LPEFVNSSKSRSRVSGPITGGARSLVAVPEAGDAKEIKKAARE